MRRYKHSKTRQAAYLARRVKKSKTRNSYTRYWAEAEKEYKEQLAIQAEALRIARTISNPILAYMLGIVE